MIEENRVCPVCRRPMERRENEKASHFRQRVTCGAPKCGGAQRARSTAETLAKRAAERRAAMPEQSAKENPRQATTVKEFLALGGKIMKCPTRYARGSFPPSEVLP